MLKKIPINGQATKIKRVNFFEHVSERRVDQARRTRFRWRCQRSLKEFAAFEATMYK